MSDYMDETEDIPGIDEFDSLEFDRNNLIC